MTHRLRRLAPRFLAISLLAATLFTVDSLASPSPAQARCDGVNNPVYSWFRYDRAVVQASETPGHGTCNGNNTFTGQLEDKASDGYCVSVWFQETGTNGWVPPDGGAIVVCGNGNKATITWTDNNLNSYVYEQFCVHRASNLEAVACGWGDRWARPSQYGGPYGVNHGF